MRRISAVTIAGAVLLGGATAWWAVPRWQLERALDDIVAPGAERRAAGWRRLSTSRRDGEPPLAAEHLDRVNERLQGADEQALCQAADELHKMHRWGWEHQAPAVILRELELRSRMDAVEDQRLVVRVVRTAPLDVDPEQLRTIIERLLASDDAAVRRDIWSAAASWTGPEGVQLLVDLVPRDDDTGVRRLRELALTACRRESEASTDEWLRMPADLAEAAMLRRIVTRPDDVGPLLDAAQAWPDEPRPAFAAILRYADAPEVTAALRTWSVGGDRAATYALQARSPAREIAAAQRVATDVSEPPWRRRLAAWRWSDVPRAVVDDLLALDPVEPDGSVYAVALLAERALPRDEAATLAESWIRDFDDDRKRAGALLAALLGAHAALLAEAFSAEDVPAVRNAHRLALIAVNADPGPGSADEFAHRVMHRANGEIAPDVACAMLAAGRASMLRRLIAAPPDGWGDGRSAQARAWLIERFVPAWHARYGRPLGTLRGLQLHFDLLGASALLAERRLEFDRPARAYRPPGVEAIGAAAP